MRIKIECFHVDSFKLISYKKRCIQFVTNLFITETQSLHFNMSEDSVHSWTWCLSLHDLISFYDNASDLSFNITFGRSLHWLIFSVRQERWSEQKHTNKKRSKSLYSSHFYCLNILNLGTVLSTDLCLCNHLSSTWLYCFQKINQSLTKLSASCYFVSGGNWYNILSRISQMASLKS